MTLTDLKHLAITKIQAIGLPPIAELGLYLAFLVLGGLFANFVVKRLLLRGLERGLTHTSFGKDQELRRHGVIPRLANVVPALFISGGLTLIPGMPPAMAAVISNLTNAFIILTLALAAAGALAIIDTIYHRKPVGRERPIKSYIQVVKIVLYLVATIFIVSTLIDRSPVILLSGLGAMAAVLILVFQDTLLSIVAGLQISSHDMIRVGDWIEMPSLNADGDVIEIALHTVKVQNWDKTITSIPIRKLVSDSFKNWRGMKEAGGRRIKRAVHIDQNTVGFLSRNDVERLSRLRHLRGYLAAKRAEVAEWNAELGEDAALPANLRRLTNIGTFRAYVEAFLRSSPHIRDDMTFLVRQLPPSEKGVPIEIYCFTDTTEWAVYEAIQSDIFDHLIAILPEFGLAAFQGIAGRDLAAMRAA